MDIQVASLSFSLVAAGIWGQLPPQALIPELPAPPTQGVVPKSADMLDRESGALGAAAG